jgi:hypothetical protein
MIDFAVAFIFSALIGKNHLFARILACIVIPLGVPLALAKDLEGAGSRTYAFLEVGMVGGFPPTAIALMLGYGFRLGLLRAFRAVKKRLDAK